MIHSECSPNTRFFPSMWLRILVLPSRLFLGASVKLGEAFVLCRQSGLVPSWGGRGASVGVVSLCAGAS